DRILKEGIGKDIRAGKVYCVPSSVNRAHWTLHQVSAATLHEALYDAHAEKPDNEQVLATIHGGVRDVVLLQPTCPAYVLQYYRDEMNRLTGYGSQRSWLERIKLVVDIDAKLADDRSKKRAKAAEQAPDSLDSSGGSATATSASTAITEYVGAGGDEDGDEEDDDEECECGDKKRVRSQAGHQTAEWETIQGAWPALFTGMADFLRTRRVRTKLKEHGVLTSVLAFMDTHCKFTYAGLSSNTVMLVQESILKKVAGHTDYAGAEEVSMLALLYLSAPTDVLPYVFKSTADVNTKLPNLFSRMQQNKHFRLARIPNVNPGDQSAAMLTLVKADKKEMPKPAKKSKEEKAAEAEAKKAAKAAEKAREKQQKADQKKADKKKRKRGGEPDDHAHDGAPDAKQQQQLVQPVRPTLDVPAHQHGWANIVSGSDGTARTLTFLDDVKHTVALVLARREQVDKANGVDFNATTLAAKWEIIVLLTACGFSFGCDKVLTTSLTTADGAMKTYSGEWSELRWDIYLTLCRTFDVNLDECPLTDDCCVEEDEEQPELGPIKQKIQILLKEHTYLKTKLANIYETNRPSCDSTMDEVKESHVSYTRVNAAILSALRGDSFETAMLPNVLKGVVFDKAEDNFSSVLRFLTPIIHKEVPPSLYATACLLTKYALVKSGVVDGSERQFNVTPSSVLVDLSAAAPLVKWSDANWKTFKEVEALVQLQPRYLLLGMTKLCDYFDTALTMDVIPVKFKQQMSDLHAFMKSGVAVAMGCKDAIFMYASDCKLDGLDEEMWTTLFEKAVDLKSAPVRKTDQQWDTLTKTKEASVRQMTPIQLRKKLVDDFNVKTDAAKLMAKDTMVSLIAKKLVHNAKDKLVKNWDVSVKAFFSVELDGGVDKDGIDDVVSNVFSEGGMRRVPSLTLPRAWCAYKVGLELTDYILDLWNPNFKLDQGGGKANFKKVWVPIDLNEYLPVKDGWLIRLAFVGAISLEETLVDRNLRQYANKVEIGKVTIQGHTYIMSVTPGGGEGSPTCAPAWSVRGMSEDDFHKASENNEWIEAMVQDCFEFDVTVGGVVKVTFALPFIGVAPVESAPQLAIEDVHQQPQPQKTNPAACGALHPAQASQDPGPPTAAEGAPAVEPKESESPKEEAAAKQIVAVELPGPQTEPQKNFGSMEFLAFDDMMELVRPMFPDEAARHAEKVDRRIAKKEERRERARVSDGVGTVAQQSALLFHLMQ
ncbi:unnamed protein product, partial [Prorocentrum cordatum]